MVLTLLAFKVAFLFAVIVVSFFFFKSLVVLSYSEYATAVSNF